MKRLILVFVALFALSGVFAQNEIPLSYTLNPQNAISFPVYLRGPSPSCQPIHMTLEASYQHDDDLINVKVRYKYEKPLMKKDQYTHLWFPMSISECPYGDFSFEDHFKRNFRSKVALNEPIRAQVKVTQTTDLFKPAFQCVHGQLLNQKDLDVMVSLNEGKVIVLKIKVLDNNKPVVLKINNVIPLRARFNFPMIFNKAYLDYISNSYAITLRLPEGGCYGLNETISQYKRWNDDLKSDYGDLLNYLIDNSSSMSDKKEALRKRLQILYKYDVARKGIRETDCEELLREFDIFRTFYNKVSEGVISADSIRRLITQTAELIDNISIAKNTGNTKVCLKYKKEAEVFSNVEIEESLYKDFPEMQRLVKKFEDNRSVLESLSCPVTPPPPSCNIDGERIISSTKKINNLLNEYRLKKVKKEQEFNNIVKETDSYLKKFPDACKNNKKYKTIITQYQDAKRAYQNAIK